MTAEDPKTTQATGGDVAKDTPPAETKEAKATKETKEAKAAQKWFKVLSGCIHGVLHSAKFPYVQLSDDEAKAYGKDYIQQKGYATEKDCPLEEDKED